MRTVTGKVTDTGGKCVCAGKRIAAWSDDSIRGNAGTLEPPARISKLAARRYVVVPNANETWA